MKLRINERVAMIALVMTLFVGRQANAQVSLGEAANFVILALDNGTMTINSATSISGDVGYSNGVVSTTNQKIDAWTGGAYIHSGSSVDITPATYMPSNGVLTGPAVDARLNQANADAQAAIPVLNGLAATQMFGVISGSTIFNSTGSLNVIDVAGVLLNGETLTLNSRPGFTDTFIFRIDNGFLFSQSIIDLNGITPANVLYYFPNDSSISINKASTEFFGTIFAPTGDVEYHNPATFEGAIIAKDINVHSDFNIAGVPFNVPEPSSALYLAAVGTLLVASRRRRPVTAAI